jgi:type IV pilus assembly protein PilA
MRRAAGFTLIELMLVVTIIAVLAALSIPQYMDYVTRSRWSDNLSQVGSLKQALGECVQSNGGQIAPGLCDSVPNLIGAQFLPGNYLVPSAVDSPYLGGPVMVVGGTILILGSDLAANCVVSLTPTVVPGAASIRWNATVAALPAGCSMAVLGNRETPPL